MAPPFSPVTSAATRLALVVAVLILAGCASAPLPDLKNLYAASGPDSEQPPVVLIHGVMGSRLNDVETGEEIWPGSVGRLIFHNYTELALPIDPQTLEPLPGRLRVAGITDRAAGRDFYGRIIRVLRDVGGYVESRPGDPAVVGDRRFYVFLYDWRQDNVHSAAQLDDFIEQIRSDYDDPFLKVDLIAHSMGGLVARYYLRYGKVDTLDDNDFPVNYHGAERVRRVVLLGTPSVGAAKAVRVLMEGFKLVFGSVPAEAVVTYPSTYQVLPHPLNDWLITLDGQPLERDVFSSELWRRFEFSVFNDEVAGRIRDSFDDAAEADAYLETLKRYFEKRIERGRRFVWALTVPAPEMNVRLIVFGSDCFLTPARALVEEVDGESVLRLTPDEIANPKPGIDYERLMLEPGDGTVTKASLLARSVLNPTVARHQYSFFPVDYAIFLCESHEGLTGNINFQDNLLHALLSAD